MKRLVIPLTIIGLLVLLVLGWREVTKPSNAHLLRGQLVDRDGVPISGAEIRYLHMTRGPELFVRSVTEENRLFRTDANGRFEVDCPFSIAQIDAVVLSDGRILPYRGKVIQILNSLPGVPLGSGYQGYDPDSVKPFTVIANDDFAS